MHIETLNDFLTVLSAGSINKAAIQLNMQQQRLSKMISTLETDLGASLLVRSSKGVQLTKDGETILPIIIRIVEDYHLMKKTLNSKHREKLKGTLRLHLPLNIGIDDNPAIHIIERFLLEYPGVNIITDEMGAEQIVDTLNESPKDIGFIVKDISENGSIVNIPQQFNYLPLRKLKLCVFAGQDSIFAQKNKSYSLKTLKKEPLVVYSTHSDYPPPTICLFDHLGGANFRYIVGSKELLHKILHDGLAVAIGYRRSLTYMTRHHIVEIPINEDLFIESGLLYSPDYIEDPLINAFITIAKDYYKTSRNRE